MTAAARRLVVSQVDTAILALVSFCKFPESVLSVTQAKQGASSTFDSGNGLVTGRQRICHALVRLDDTHKLTGSNPEEEAQVLQWTSLCNTHIDPAAATGARANGVKVLTYINEHLNACTHLVANRLSLADIMVSAAVQPILSALEVSAQSGIANVTSWYGRIQSEMGNALPVLKLKTPEDELAEKMAAAKVADEKQPKKQKQAPAPKPAAAPELPELSLLDIRVGKIVHVEKHPDADALYVEKIDVGEETPRTICSGLVKYTTPERLQDRMVLVLCNLKPVNMRGIHSQGMLLAASDEGKSVVEPLDPPANSKPGDVVTFNGFERQPADVLHPKKKIWEKVQPEFKTDSNGVAHYKDIPFAVSGGQVTASVKNGNIS